MSFLIKALLYPIIFVVFLIATFPTKYAYYYLQHSLYKDFTITTKEKQISSMPFMFDIKNLEIGLDGERVATLSSLSLKTFLFTNTFEINDIHVDDSLAPAYLKQFKSLKVTYNILEPLDVYIKPSSPIFVKGHIYFDISSLTIKATMFIRSSQAVTASPITRYFKYKRKGVYIYDYKL